MGCIVKFSVDRYFLNSEVVAEDELEFVKFANVSGEAKDAWVFDGVETLRFNLPYYEHGYGPYLGVSETFKANMNEKKLNLGVGAYRTEEIRPCVLNVVKKVVYWKDEFGFMLADILKQNKVNDSGMRFDPGVRTVDFDRFIAEYENDHTSCSLSTLINFTATEEEIEEALYRI
ncbi:uncharacterized protein LOC110689450 [Chenopodium quinoa]|uniref:uncharacterized protein LOC110689450 n=1 Tax=Chenopodium quinoa TaxID=63459 RepID=UPI000B796A68|nr:uncharacterized protein LOC110689450 [Chenopodium quinoa]